MTDFRQLAEKHPMAGQKAIFKLMAGKAPSGVADSPEIKFTTTDVKEIQTLLLLDVRTNMVEAGGFKTLEETRSGLVLNVDRITDHLKSLARAGQQGIAADSFYNALTGIGTSIDPGYYNAATIPISMSPNEATSYYASGGIPAIVIDKKAKGIWMNGYQFVSQDWDEKDLKTLRDYADKVNFEPAAQESWRDGLMYGGSVLTPAFKKDTPLTYEMSWNELVKRKIVEKDCLDYFWSADRWNSVLIPDFNISAKDYLNPRLIMIPLAGHAVHRDRMALIRPKKLPYWGTLRQIGWGVSDFEGWIRSLLAYEIMIASLPMISQQLSLLYRHLPFDATAGMTGIRAAKKAAQEASLQLKQWNLLNPQTFNSVGELKTIERHFTDFDKLIMIARQDVGAKSGISDTILFHTQASGFSDNEEDTLLKEAATIKEGANEAVLQLQPLVKVLIASCFGTDSTQFAKYESVRISFDSPTVLTNDQKVASLTALGGFVSSMQMAGMQLGDTMTVAQQFLTDLEVPDDMALRIKAFDDREQEFEDESRDLTLEQGKSALESDEEPEQKPKKKASVADSLFGWFRRK